MSGTFSCVDPLKVVCHSTLGDILIFVEAQVDRSRAVRVIYSIADVAKIREYRERLNHAMHQFGVSIVSSQVAQLTKADRNMIRSIHI